MLRTGQLKEMIRISPTKPRGAVRRIINSPVAGFPTTGRDARNFWVAHHGEGLRLTRVRFAGFVLDALEQAVHDRRPRKGIGLAHPPRQGRPVSVDQMHRATGAGIEPSVGSYDNALAKTINGLFEAEVT